MDSLENVVDIPIAFNKYREESRRKKFFPPEKKDNEEFHVTIFQLNWERGPGMR